ncbi:DMT family transporter [Ruegeria marina]|uniref:Permease of the drug/metabolite transporter (DMT) superfamily n=1 Tax=Ruegeria marina TaxID=639004 RepID=A0A1G6YXB7_9RHOB|nr:DMT family transporter [Ruegeria marina]SDD94285.1 Permease of the drug/metabolite transporter (DMT) superfamily [Ruegeria marina]
MTDTPQITSASWAMIATLGFVWGGTFLVQAMALETAPPFWVAAGRIGFAALLTALVWQLRGARMFTTDDTDWPTLTLVAVLSAAAPFMLIAWSQQYVTSSFTGVSMAAVALIVLPMAHVLLPGERMTWRKSLGFVIGFAGIVVLIGPGAFASSGAGMEPLGRLACLSAAGCYAISSVLMRRLPPLDPVGLSAATLLIGSAVVIPLALASHGLPANPGNKGLMLIALLGLVPTAAANLLRIIVARTAGPVFMSLTNYQVPVWSVLLGALVLGEDLPPTLLWAMLMILTGVALSQYGALRRLFTGR